MDKWDRGQWRLASTGGIQTRPRSRSAAVVGAHPSLEALGNTEPRGSRLMLFGWQGGACGVDVEFWKKNDVATVRRVGFIDMFCGLNAGGAERVQYFMFRGNFLRARDCAVPPGMKGVPLGTDGRTRTAPAAVLITIFNAAVQMADRVRCRTPRAGGSPGG